MALLFGSSCSGELVCCVLITAGVVCGSQGVASGRLWGSSEESCGRSSHSTSIDARFLLRRRRLRRTVMRASSSSTGAVHGVGDGDLLDLLLVRVAGGGGGGVGGCTALSLLEAGTLAATLLLVVLPLLRRRLERRGRRGGRGGCCELLALDALLELAVDTALPCESGMSTSLASLH